MKMTIDRIEEGVAVLLSREDRPRTMSVPLSFLPPGSREGDIVTVEIGRDGEETRETTDRVRDLITKLKNKRPG
jgi:hypothetical protein